jgi:hypothetical protein
MNVNKEEKEAQVINFEKYNIETTAEALQSFLENKNEEEKTKAIKTINSAVEAAGVTAVGKPSMKMRDKLWLIVVIAFAIVLIGSFATLAFGVFVNAQGKVTPELILTMFTSVVGFLAGLFVPSPLQNSNDSKL